ncbi:unnamed protein product [Chrysoparadoxa australica]
MEEDKRDERDEYDLEEESPFPRWLEGDSLAPDCQSDLAVVTAMLELANVTEADFVFDLGCGDGRVCLTATKKYGTRSRGIEIEKELIEKFQRGVGTLEQRLQDKVQVVHGDLRKVDLSEATVVFLYMLPEAMAELEPQLLSWLGDCGSSNRRLVCQTWGLKGIKPVARVSKGEWQNVDLLLFTKVSLSL